MAGVTRSVAVSPFLVGDPLRLGPDVASIAAVIRESGVYPAVEPAALRVAPGVLLIHALAGEAGGIELRWAHLPHTPALLQDGEPIRTVAILTASLPESGHALRVAGRLMACLRGLAGIEPLAAATTREELVAILSRVEVGAGETPLSTADLLALLGTAAGGLSAAEAARRRAACGSNRLERIARRSLAARLLDQFTSFFALLLWVGGAFAFLAGLPELGWAIFGVIVINGVFSFFQEYRAERAVEALQELLPREVAVLRDGAELRVPAADLVPGDIVRLEEGDQVPADGQLLQATGLRVDQSALTGESHPVFKLPALGDERENVPLAERHELLFAGTGAVAGSGTFVVRATGMRTEIGGIARLTQSVPEEPSPLQREMVRVTRLVTLLAVGFGAGFFVLGVATRALPVGEGFLFASNVPELVPFLAFVFLGIPLPLTVMQILAVDLGTDLLPALALGAEPPEPDIMDRPPRPRAERLLGTGRLLHAYGFLGMAEAALSLLGFFWAYWLAGWRPGLPMAAAGDLYRRATTMTLAGIVATQVGNVFACRTDRESAFRAGLFRNRAVLLGIAAEIGLLLALIWVPPLRHVFGLAPLELEEWGLLLLFPPMMLALDESRKHAVRRLGRAGRQSLPGT
ncbi:MAG: hypothetical protein A3K12_08960 [Candidatus Rokubacteria bacterium RIFCSPLOWO2_12_FULL_71_19]|nr:MAG: hypothetical protein A3K12_08960 [Candidatus Rokubacteria bacterium RIFCSPLOWO2_12_FULL_71_19]